jgi:hypothetical protein
MTCTVGTSTIFTAVVWSQLYDAQWRKIHVCNLEEIATMHGDYPVAAVGTVSNVQI